jgi:hypothetical protein
MSSLGLKAMTWSWELFGAMTFVTCGLLVLQSTVTAAEIGQIHDIRLVQQGNGID